MSWVWHGILRQAQDKAPSGASRSRTSRSAISHIGSSRQTDDLILSLSKDKAAMRIGDVGTNVRICHDLSGCRS